MFSFDSARNKMRSSIDWCDLRDPCTSYLLLLFSGTQILNLTVTIHSQTWNKQNSWLISLTSSQFRCTCRNWNDKATPKFGDNFEKDRWKALFNPFILCLFNNIFTLNFNVSFAKHGCHLRRRIYTSKKEELTAFWRCRSYPSTLLRSLANCI